MRRAGLIIFFTTAAALMILFALGRATAELDKNSAAVAALSVNPEILAMRRKVAAMSRDEKIGQMLMVSIPGIELSDATAGWLRSRHVGGVILLGQNVRTKTQTEAFINDLQEKARDPADAPLLIAVDQEGGAVVRFRFLEELTAQRNMADEDAAYAAAETRGRELRGLGVNVNFSPVLDIASSSADFIYPRAFAGDTATVNILGSAMIRGYRDSGIIAVAKHFPGHGGTRINSHISLPVLQLNDQEWRDNLAPFESAIQNAVPAVMIGHLKISGRDDEYPASISEKIITGVLRKELGYRGVVITDDLGMGAITRNFPLTDAALRAVQAGADIALVVRNFRDYDMIYEALKAAADRGISERRINQSVARILSLKEKYLKNQ